MQRIPFPRRTFADFSNALAELINVRRMMLPGQELVFDLRPCQHLSPFLLGGTAALVKRWEEDGYRVVVDTAANDPGLRNYLQLIGYPQGYWNAANTFEARRRLVLLQSRNHVPLIGFKVSGEDGHTREQLIQALEDLLVKQCKLQGGTLSAMKYLIAELTDNIGLHAGHGSGFVLAQYQSSLQCLDLCIADTGQGLLGSYLKSGFHHPKNDVEALQLALSGRSTKYDGRSRGFGIPSTRRMLVHGMGGSFFMWSGEASIFHTPDRENIFQFKDGSSFPGCYFALRIPTVPDPSFKYYEYTDRR